MLANRLPHLSLAALLGFGLSIGFSQVHWPQSSMANQAGPARLSLGMEAAIAAQPNRNDRQVAQARTQFYTNRTGLAIEGTDPVAYFLVRRPVTGRK